MNKVSIVVAERGSNWVDWARHLRQDAGSTIVIAQHAAEDDAEFARRVQQRLARLRAEGAPVDKAAFVSGDAPQPSPLDTRPSLLRKLSTVLSATGQRSRLYLDATAGPPPVRRMMTALASTLSELAAGSGLSISVDSPPLQPAV